MIELRRKIYELVVELEREYGIPQALPVTQSLTRAYDALKKLEAEHAAEARR